MRLINKKTGKTINVQKLELNNGGIDLTYTIEQKTSYGSLAALNEEWVEEAEEKPSIKKVGNIYPSGGQNGNVYNPSGISPTLASGETSTKSNGGIGSNNAPKIIEPTPLQREVCNKALEKGLVEPNDAIEYTYSNARLKEIKQGFIKKQNIIDNQVMSTLKTNPQQIGVCVETTKKSFDVQPLKIKTANKKGYDEAVDGDGVDLQYPNSNTRRGRVGHGVSKTIMTGDLMGVVHNYRIRKLTPKECWRLMGFDDEDFEKVAQVNSNTQLYKQAGNSIVVNVLEAILGNLLKGA